MLDCMLGILWDDLVCIMKGGTGREVRQESVKLMES